MNFVEVSRQVSVLREAYRADGALEGMHFGVLPEVVLQVAAPFEHFIAAINSASKIELWSLFVFAANFDCSIPLTGDIAEGLRLEVDDLARRALTRV